MDALFQVPLTLCVGKPTLTITGGAASTIATTNTSSTQITYSIKGKFYAKAMGAGITTPATDANTGAAFTALAASQGCCFVIGLDSGGNYKAVQGPVQALDASGLFITAPAFPAVPDTVCPIGYVVIKNGSTGSAWTFGLSNWNATGVVTPVPVDVVTLPDRPQVA